jgi:hypothetical protein
MKVMTQVRIVIALAATPAQAQWFTDGNKLLADCRDQAKEGICLGYIAGAVDGYNELLDIYGLHDLAMTCPPSGPSGVTLGQVKDLVVNELIANPVDRNLNTAMLVERAINNAWHCMQCW